MFYICVFPTLVKVMETESRREFTKDWRREGWEVSV